MSFLFFFQAEDGIRALYVTGVQTCALPIYFVIVTGMEPAKTQRLALPGPVDGERMPAAPGELESREENAHLLAVVHAVEHDHCRRASRRSRGFHEQRGQRRIFVRHLHALDVRVAPLQACVLALKGLAADLAFFLARDHEALPGEVIHAGAQETVARRELAPLAGCRVGGALEP